MKKKVNILKIFEFLVKMQVIRFSYGIKYNLS